MLTKIPSLVFGTESAFGVEAVDQTVLTESQAVSAAMWHLLEAAPYEAAATEIPITEALMLF